MSQVKKPTETNTAAAGWNNGSNGGKPPAQTGGWGGPQPVLTLPNGKTVNPWLVLLSIVFGFFMSLLDATITNVALTNIQNDLKTDLTTVTWVINAYSIAFAALLVTMGRFADQFGRKRIFMMGMVVFSAGSLLCAIAPSVEFLIAFRIIQGIGAAALNSVSLAIITGVFPPQKRGAAIGIWGALAGLAAAVGPILGGFLLNVGVGNLEWRWIFYVNLPFCIIGLFLITRNVPEMRDTNATRKLDLAGLLTLSAGMICLSLALIEGNDWNWDARIIGLFVGVIAALGLFAFVEFRQQQPILDFSLFKIRSFSAANIVMFMFSIAMQGAFLMLILYFINAQGYKELDAAYALIPLPLASFVVSALASRVGNRVSAKVLAITGMAIVGIGFLSFYTLDVNSGYLDTAWRGIIVGIGMALCFNSLPNMALSEVPRPKLGVASGAFNTFRQFGFVIGVALLISLFSGQISSKSADARIAAINDVKATTTLPDATKNQIITGLQQSANQPATGRGSANNNASQYANTAIGQQISGEFKKAAVDSFTPVWFASAMIALFGIIPALFTNSPAHMKHGASNRQGADEASAAAAAV